MGILAFLWRGSMMAAHLDEPGQFWRNIVSSGWAPGTVTICAAALRMAITAQAALVASMVAALLLEKYAVPLHSAPFLSVVRAVSIQPIQLLYAQGAEVAQVSALFGLPTLLIDGFIAMASTFTSTILLSDFDTVTILAGPVTSVRTFNLSADAGIVHWNIWRTGSMGYPRFAEYGEPPTSGEAFVDTGVTIRALLPFQDRGQPSALRNYAGPASVFDARTICVRPTIHISNLTADQEMFITGQVLFDGDYPYGLRVPEPSLPMDFRCALAGFDYRSQTPWDTSICKLTVVLMPVGDQGQFGNFGQPSTGYPYLVSPLLMGTEMALIFNMTKPKLGWGNMTGYRKNIDTRVVNAGLPTITPDGPWAKATFADAEGAEIAATACFTSLNGFEYYVSASSASASDSPEPDLTWAGEIKLYPSEWASMPPPPPSSTTSRSEPAPPSFNTLPLRRQLGATQRRLGGKLLASVRSI